MLRSSGMLWRDRFIYASRSNASEFYMLSAWSTTSRYKTWNLSKMLLSLMNSTCHNVRAIITRLTALNLRRMQMQSPRIMAKALNSFEGLS